MAAYESLIAEHQALQEQLAEKPEAIPVAEVLAFLDRVRTAGKEIEDVEQRDQLRAILRHWGAFVFERTGEYPAVHLATFEGLPTSKGVLENLELEADQSAIFQLLSDIQTSVSRVHIDDSLALLRLRKRTAVLIIIGLVLVIFLAVFIGTRFGRINGGDVDITVSPTPQDEETPTSEHPPTPSVTPTPCTGPPQDWAAYIVQPGDTPFSIASQTGLTVEALVAANCPYTVGTLILPGQTIYVPPGMLPPTVTPTLAPTPTVTPQPSPTTLPTRPPTATPTPSQTPTPAAQSI